MKSTDSMWSLLNYQWHFPELEQQQQKKKFTIHWKHKRPKIAKASISHEVMGPDAMVFVFWMLSFKPTFSLSSFTFIKRLFSSSSLSAIRVVSSAYLRLLIFLSAIPKPHNMLVSSKTAKSFPGHIEFRWSSHHKIKLTVTQMAQANLYYWTKKENKSVCLN